jgi:GNAT superfamily N-acetyltransferase
MMWTREQKIEAAIRAPMANGIPREDTQIIERPGWWQIITPSTKSTIQNEVVFSQLDESEADGVIEREIANYQSYGLPVKWFVTPATRPHDFGARLAKRGFNSWDTRAMCCDTSLRLDVGDVEMTAVDEQTLDAYIDTFLGGWDVARDQRAPMRKQHLAALSRSPRVAYFWLATIDGEPAGTTGLLLRDRYAYLVGAQVLDRFRGKGVYRALIETRLDFLRQRGVTLAVTLAREATSAPMLAHLGFETLFPCRVYLLP